MANEKPWEDWPITSIESDLTAGWFVKNSGIFQGYSEIEFRPNELLKMRHFKAILDRAHIQNMIFPTEDPVTVAFSQDYLPNTAWIADQQSFVTRFRAAVMIYRYRNGIVNPTPVEPTNKDAEVAKAIEKLFQDKPVTWNGITRYSKLIGYEKVIVEDAREYNIPIWFALGQCWRESQWFTTGLSINYNCGWGIKDSKGTWGILGNPPTVLGYTNYVSVEEAIHAYFRLMSSPDKPYRALIDRYLETGYMANIYDALDIYAPSYENDTYQHHRIVTKVKQWCDERGIK